MSTDEIRSMLLGGDIAAPYTVHTMGGRSYEVTDPAHVWAPPGFAGVVVIAVPRLGPRRRAARVNRLHHLRGTRTGDIGRQVIGLLS